MKLRVVGNAFDVTVEAPVVATLEAAVTPVFLQHGITQQRVAVYCDGGLLIYSSTLAELGIEDDDQLDVDRWPRWHWMGNQPPSGPTVPNVAAPVLLQLDLLRRIIEVIGLPFMPSSATCRLWASAGALSLRAWHVALEGMIDWTKHPPDAASPEWQALKRREQASYDEDRSAAIEHGLEQHGEAIFEAPAFDGDPLRGAPRREVLRMASLPAGRLAVLQKHHDALQRERLLHEEGHGGVDVLVLEPRHAGAASLGWKPKRGRRPHAQDEGPELAMDLALCRRLTLSAPKAGASATLLASDGEFLYVSWRTPAGMHQSASVAAGVAAHSILKYGMSDGVAVRESGYLSHGRNRQQPASVTVKRMVVVGQWILCLVSLVDPPVGHPGYTNYRRTPALLLLRRDTLEREGHIMPLPTWIDPVDLAIADDKLCVIGTEATDGPDGRPHPDRPASSPSSFVLIYQLRTICAADEMLRMWQFLEPSGLDHADRQFRLSRTCTVHGELGGSDGVAAMPHRQILFDPPLPSVHQERDEPRPPSPSLSRIAFYRGRMVLVSDHRGYEASTVATLYVCTQDVAVLHVTMIEGPANECYAVSLCADAQHIFLLSSFHYPFGSGSEESRTCLGVYSCRGACPALLAHPSPPCEWAATVRARHARFPECRAESTQENDGSVVMQGYCECRRCSPRSLPGICACAACGWRSSTSQCWPFSLQGAGIEVEVDEVRGVRLGAQGFG